MAACFSRSWRERSRALLPARPPASPGRTPGSPSEGSGPGPTTAPPARWEKRAARASRVAGPSCTGSGSGSATCTGRVTGPRTPRCLAPPSGVAPGASASGASSPGAEKAGPPA